DRDHSCSAESWRVDPYQGKVLQYDAVSKAIAYRRAALDAAAIVLSKEMQWPSASIEEFRQAAMHFDGELSLHDEVMEGVRSWRTGEGWAKKPNLADWSESLLAELKDADLRGMGGAGIPAVQKWRDVRDAIRTAFRREIDTRGFIVVNGDESEPSAFKDRVLLLRKPHLIVEGVILAGLITEATEGFIFIRHEYQEQIAACREEIARAERLGLCGPNASLLGRSFPVSVFVSPGG